MPTGKDFFYRVLTVHRFLLKESWPAEELEHLLQKSKGGLKHCSVKNWLNVEYKTFTDLL